ncbi:hypothetical protein BH18ACI5_BH18ACI5_05610 [soil metagenome]
MEKTPIDDATRTLALANAAQLLARNGGEELAAEYLEKTQILMTRMKDDRQLQ